MTKLRVIYDGHCPFCSAYVRVSRLRQGHEVELVDAREAPEIAAGYGLDLDKGMIVDLGGTVYHGADAVWLLSTLSSHSGWANALFSRMFSNRRLAQVSYPVMRAARNATLAILRRDRLG